MRAAWCSGPDHPTMGRGGDGRRRGGRSVALPLLLALLLGFSLTIWGRGAARAAGPEDDLRAANATLQRSLMAAQSGDLVTAQREYRAYETAWLAIEDGIRAKSRDAYRTIEADMKNVDLAFAQTPPDQSQIVAALSALDRSHQQFILGQPVTGPSTAPQAAPKADSDAHPSIASLLQHLNDARSALARNDYATAAARMKQFQLTWLEVEGQVKTRSADDYRQTENDMELASSLLNERSPEAGAVLDRLATRLEPYREAARYSVFDAAIILLREGLEALLILVALLAFLERSGNAERRGWIWAGAGIGLLASVILGIALQLVLSSVMNPANRELIEGITGLAAAGMLLYVGVWLHSKTHIGDWQRYIGERTGAALATGSMIGLAVLSFLAVFREGAETVLFYLGMATNIALGDLLIGLGIGAGALIVLGILILVAGVRLPLRPFFAIATLLVFYLCFKFLGMGIHALQVADALPASSADYLPASDFLGLFPTWETVLPQIVLVIVALAIVLRGMVRSRLARSGRSTAAVAPH